MDSYLQERIEAFAKEYGVSLEVAAEKIAMIDECSADSDAYFAAKAAEPIDWDSCVAGTLREAARLVPLAYRASEKQIKYLESLIRKSGRAQEFCQCCENLSSKVASRMISSLL